MPNSLHFLFQIELLKKDLREIINVQPMDKRSLLFEQLLKPLDCINNEHLMQILAALQNLRQQNNEQNMLRHEKLKARRDKINALNNDKMKMQAKIREHDVTVKTTETFLNERIKDIQRLRSAQEQKRLQLLEHLKQLQCEKLNVSRSIEEFTRAIEQNDLEQQTVMQDFEEFYTDFSTKRQLYLDEFDKKLEEAQAQMSHDMQALEDYKRRMAEAKQAIRQNLLRNGRDNED